MARSHEQLVLRLCSASLSGSDDKRVLKEVENSQMKKQRSEYQVEERRCFVFRARSGVSFRYANNVEECRWALSLCHLVVFL